MRDKKLKFSNDKINLLWECCQIPDFQKKTYTHIDVVTKVFNFLNSGKKRIPNEYMKNQLKGLDKYRGNIDMISNKISDVRTWSYVANKKIGLIILIIGLKQAKILKIFYPKDCTKN